VLAALAEARTEARLLDLSAYPTRTSLSLTCGPDGPPRSALSPLGEDPIDLSRCHAAWWRRPQPLGLAPTMRLPAHRAFAYAECHAALASVWATLDAAWINDPVCDELAGRKALQLAIAREAGLQIPETLITSEPSRARAFVSEHGLENTVYKAFTGTLEAWRETRILRPEEVDQLDAVAHAPVIFQAYVPAALDLRVTIVDGRIFAASIDSQATAYGADYRMHMDETAVEPYVLPEIVAERLQLVLRRLGLVYGALDLRLRPDGEHVFLEINPSGQWRFIEDRTGQPITDAVVSALRARQSAQPSRQSALRAVQPRQLGAHARVDVPRRRIGLEDTVDLDERRDVALRDRPESDAGEQRGAS
jgi:glutathione synthase/RimK-type ligase-like ATP-grasp enzyme